MQNTVFPGPCKPSLSRGSSAMGSLAPLSEATLHSRHAFKLQTFREVRFLSVSDDRMQQMFTPLRQAHSRASKERCCLTLSATRHQLFMHTLPWSTGLRLSLLTPPPPLTLSTLIFTLILASQKLILQLLVARHHPLNYSSKPDSLIHTGALHC